MTMEQRYDKCINWPCQLKHGHPGRCETYPTDDYDYDEPGVLAINPADLPPLATEADHKAAYRRLWIEYMVSLGIPEHVAGAEFDAAPWDEIKGMDYKLAAETAMEVWDVE